MIYSSSIKVFNSSAPVRFQFNFRKVIFKLTLVNGGWGMSNEIALRWMPLDFAYDKSTLVQVMAWCRQATSHHLSQCWPRSMSPNGVTRPQWVMVQCWLESKHVTIHFSLYQMNDKLTSIQVMAWCHQARAIILSQYWPRSMSPYVIVTTRPQ